MRFSPDIHKSTWWEWSLFIPTGLPKVWTAPLLPPASNRRQPGSNYLFIPLVSIVSEPSLPSIHPSTQYYDHPSTKLSVVVIFDLYPPCHLYFSRLKCWHKYVCRAQLTVSCQEQKVSRHLFNERTQTSSVFTVIWVNCIYFFILFSSSPQSIWPHELERRNEMRLIRP